MTFQPIDDAPKGDGETLRLQLADGRIVAGYWNHDRKAWGWLNGHAGLCYDHGASADYRPVAWAPLDENRECCAALRTAILDAASSVNPIAELGWLAERIKRHDPITPRPAQAAEPQDNG